MKHALSVEIVYYLTLKVQVGVFPVYNIFLQRLLNQITEMLLSEASKANLEGPRKNAKKKEFDFDANILFGPR